MDAQAWAWLIFIVGQGALLPGIVAMQRATDPRDRDGRKAPFDAGRVASAKRLQAWTIAAWAACVLVSCAIRVVDEPAQLAWVGPMLAVLALAVGGVAIWRLARAGRRERNGAVGDVDGGGA